MDNDRIVQLESIETPFYVVYESKLRKNLELIDRVRKLTGIDIIMAFKANAMWRLFHIIRQYGFGFAASSINELRLGFEELAVRGHTYCLAYKSRDMHDICKESSHITFNSLTQWNNHKTFIKEWNARHPDAQVSAGLRVNPHCSVVETDIYNPALPGSRFGVPAEMLETLPDGIEGLHFHQLCESSSFDLKNVLESFKKSFGHLLPRLKWLNMGGGHLITADWYDTAHLVSMLKEFKSEYPNLDVILEPGSAFTWQTGDLIVSVMDIVEDSDIKTAIIDSSFTCHMPDTLEMPYFPRITQSVPDDESGKSLYKYNIGGNSCLSGDFKGTWSFEDPLQIGMRLTFEDMNHYTNVKTTMFNGLHHPSIIFVKCNGDVEIVREYSFDDYKQRMS